MGSKETGRIRLWIKEHSLLPPHWGKLCRECNNFEWGCIKEKQFRKKFCKKWEKVVNPEGWACSYFAFRLSKEDLRNKQREWARAELMHWLSWQSEATRQTVFGERWYIFRAAVCGNPFCPRERREFYYKVYGRRGTPKRFCSKRCRKEFLKFVKKIQRNSKIIEKSYQVSRAIAKQNPPSNVYSVSISWGEPSAKSPSPSQRMRVLKWTFRCFPRHNGLKYYYQLALDECGRCLRSAFVPLNH